MTRTLTFEPGETVAAITVMTTEDETQEGNEQFTATLANPTNGLQVGSANTATVVIVDDDGKKNTFFQFFYHLSIILSICFLVVISVNFNPTSYTVEEGDQINVQIELSNPSTMPVTVEVSTMEDTADGE